MPDPAASVTYNTAHCNAGSLTHWARPGIEPETSWFLVGFINHCSESDWFDEKRAVFFHTWEVEERETHLLMGFSFRLSSCQSWVHSKTSWGFHPPPYLFMKDFKYIEKLKEFYNEQPLTRSLDSTMNLLLDVLFRISPSLPQSVLLLVHFKGNCKRYCTSP